MGSSRSCFTGCFAGFIVLGLVVAGISFLLYRSAGWVMGKTVSSDPGRVSAAAGAIADFDLPDGFGEGFATRLAGYTMVGYTGADSHSHIYLFQLPRGVRLDAAEMERQYDQAAGRNTNVSRMEVVGQQDAEIRGQAVTLTIAEGVNGSGQPYRQVSGQFEGKGGQAFLIYSAPVEGWDQAAVDAFLASLR